MGKKRITILDDSSESLKETNKNKDKNTNKKEKQIKKDHPQDGLVDMTQESLKQAEIIEEKKEKQEKESLKEAQKEAKKEIKKTSKKPAKKRSKKYLEAIKKISKDKKYSLLEAIKLLKSISVSKFNGSVDVSFNTREKTLKGEVLFPHPTGKEQKIRIADEALLKDLEKNKVDFTLLIAEPKMMPKLVKFAKLLGPKGLMPNPKNGTVNDNPQEAVKKMAGKSQFKTEAKFPLIHIAIGRINDSEKDLAENFESLVKAVGKRNISKAFISPTMGPSLKIDLASF